MDKLGICHANQTSVSLEPNLNLGLGLRHELV